MEKIKFNHGWQVAVKKNQWGAQHDWSDVTLPHDAQIFEERCAEYATGTGGAFFKGNTYLYQKVFTAPEDWCGKTVVLEFEGVYQWADVSLNGDLIAKHPYGYSSFLVNITKKLKIGKENKLEVTANNSAVPNTRWYSGAGIYRSVWVRVGGEVNIHPWGVQVKTPKVCPDQSLVTATTKIVNDGQCAVRALVRSTVLACCGEEKAKDEAVAHIPAGEMACVNAALDVKSVKLWSVDEPNLYTLKTEVLVGGCVVDQAETVFGIRDIKIDTTGFYLNGVNMKLKGGCVHHDCGLLGSASFERAEERKVELMKASGYNAIRTAHNPPSPAMLNACDRLGMLVMDETFDCWRMGKNPNDYHLFFEQWWQKDTSNMVLRDFNHPSIFMWSIGNEISERGGASDGYYWSKVQADFVRSLDPTRPVTSALCGLFDPDEMKEMEESGDNILNNLVAGKVNEKNDRWGDLTAKFCEPLDMVGYNYLFHRYEFDAGKFPNRVIAGTETFPAQQFEYWQATLRNPHVIGDFVWTSLDYLGEAGLGRSEYVSGEGQARVMGEFPWNQAWCGDIDVCGFKRPQSYFRDIMWGGRDVPYIAVRHPDHFGKTPQLSPWGWNPVCESWSYPGYEGKQIRVEVYSDKDEIELLINGKSQGKQPAGNDNRNTAYFDVIYEPGVITALALSGGKPSGKSELTTCGLPASIRLSADRAEICKCDDLSYVTVEILDERGALVKYADNMITFTVSGAGCLQAVGNGNPVNDENYFGNTHSVHEGLGMAVLRSGCEAGVITLKAESTGLMGMAIQVTVK